VNKNRLKHNLAGLTHTTKTPESSCKRKPLVYPESNQCSCVVCTF